MTLSFTFRSRLWLYPAPGGWHFVTLPTRRAKEIEASQRGNRRGWGSVRVNATIGETTWKTSIFPDSKSDSYLLPVRAEVRKEEKLEDGDAVTVKLEADAQFSGRKRTAVTKTNIGSAQQTNTER